MTYWVTAAVLVDVWGVPIHSAPFQSSWLSVMRPVSKNEGSEVDLPPLKSVTVTVQ